MNLPGTLLEAGPAGSAGPVFFRAKKRACEKKDWVTNQFMLTTHISQDSPTSPTLPTLMEKAKDVAGIQIKNYGSECHFYFSDTEYGQTDPHRSSDPSAVEWALNNNDRPTDRPTDRPPCDRTSVRWLDRKFTDPFAESFENIHDLIKGIFGAACWLYLWFKWHWQQTDKQILIGWANPQYSHPWKFTATLHGPIYLAQFLIDSIGTELMLLHYSRFSIAIINGQLQSPFVPLSTLSYGDNFLFCCLLVCLL